MSARFPVLPPDLEATLTEVGDKLARGCPLTGELDRALDLMADLSPAKVARAGTAIAYAARLHPWRPMRSDAGLWLRIETGTANIEQLLRTPRLEYLFVFHLDGRVREAALLKQAGGSPTPFLFAAVAWRLNDWVPQVRAAAVRCARRCFPATNPEVIAGAAPTLLARRWTWSRWDEEHEPLDEALDRADVAERLADLIIRLTTGPMAATLRYALRRSAIDVHLERIARTAVQPSVRAVASDTLINKRAKWPSGHAWEWIDRSMGLRRRVTVFDQREVNVNQSMDALIRLAIQDRSPIVRRVAVDGVERHFLRTHEGRGYAALLIADRSPSVRERAEFILNAR